MLLLEEKISLLKYGTLPTFQNQLLNSKLDQKLMTSNSTLQTNGLLLLQTMVFQSGIYKLMEENLSKLFNITLLEFKLRVKTKVLKTKNVPHSNGTLKEQDYSEDLLMELLEYGMFNKLLLNKPSDQLDS